VLAGKRAGFFSTSWTRGLLIGAIVAPTDAAAVSALLHLRRLELRARVAAILEVESGINDPISVLLAVLLVNLLVAPEPLAVSHIVALLTQEIVGGAAFGIGGGYLLLAQVDLQCTQVRNAVDRPRPDGVAR
jgi:cell volume regulation protein A